MFDCHTHLSTGDHSMEEPLSVGATTFAPRDFFLGLQTKTHLGEVGGQVVHARLFGQFAREDDLIGGGKCGHRP